MVQNPVQSAPNFNGNLHNPMQAQMYYLKAKQAFAVGQWQDGCKFAQACISVAGNDVKLRFFAKELLAVGLTKTGQDQHALAIFIELNQLDPDYAVNIHNMGLTLLKLNRFTDAIRCFQRAVELMPANVEYYVSLGLAYHKNSDLPNAKESYQKAVQIQPSHVGAQFGVAWSLHVDGFVEDAIQAYKQVLELEPTHLVTLNNMIVLHYYLYRLDHDYLLLLLKRFGLEVSNVTKMSRRACAPLVATHSLLRIGFVSADLYTHSVGYFLESTLHQLSSNPLLCSRLTLVAYSNNTRQDEGTQRLHRCFDLWRNVEAWNDDVLVEQIRKDKIDVLIDLSGHTQGNRLTVFARQPAPLQISWLGYWGSTGLSNMDYVLVDPISVPADVDGWFCEKLWRLPSLRYCFSIPNNAPEVSPQPCISTQKIVFGCYQNLIKINSTVLECWSKVLEACPNARLRIQSYDFAKDESKKRFVERMTHAGLSIDRVDLVNGVSTQEYLTSYSEVDILLDTFPFPGGTTTAQALWMGVPTLTLAKAGMLGRQGEALMVNAGLSDWVAHSEDEYVRKAIVWGCADAQQRQELADLRATLREQVRISPVFDAKQFASDFVDALYGMWQEKCEVK